MSNHVRTGIILTGDSDAMTLVKDAAEQLGLDVLGPSVPGVNHAVSLCIPPSDSKAGWGEATKHLFKCITLVAWLCQYEKRRGYIDWVVVDYGDDGNNMPFSSIYLSHAILRKGESDVEDCWDNANAFTTSGLDKLTAEEAYVLGVYNQWGLHHRAGKQLYLYLVWDGVVAHILVWDDADTILGGETLQITPLAIAPFALIKGDRFRGDFYPTNLKRG